MKNSYVPAALLLLALPAAGLAGVIVGASGVSSPQGSLLGAPLSNIINQSGLSATYTSGVTDFATFTASTTAAGLIGAGFTGTNSVGPQTFTFDLGAVLSIGGIAVWNSSSVGRITDFELYADTDGDATNGGLTALLPNTALGNGGGLSYVFSFGPTSTQFVHFVGTGSVAPPNFFGLAEVAFDQVRDGGVPEPGTLVMLSAGAIALLLRGRNRK